MKSQHGFTLVESLLVLAVGASMVLFSYLTWERWHMHVSVPRFYQQFEYQLVRAQQIAISFNTVVWVEAKKGRDKIIINLLAPPPFGKMVVVNVPPGLTVHEHTNFQYLATSGNIDEIERFEFKEQLTGQITLYQLNLGSGRFEKK